MKLAMQAAAKTDVGIVRSSNEDNFGYNIQRGIFVVCDGMGGQAAGEVASKIAVDIVLNHFRHDAADRGAKILGRTFGGVSQRANKLANAIQLANHAIQQASGLDSQHSGMGCTIVAVLVDNGEFSVAHVGDSRVYLIRGERIQQLTSDHSLVMEQLRRGLITEEEVQQSKLQNVIVRALGSDEVVEPDLQDRDFAPGDTLLLCSDGLSRYVEDSAMLELIQNSSNLERSCEKLIGAAKGGGSDDNITCLLLRAHEQSWGERLVSRMVPGKSAQKSSC